MSFYPVNFPNSYSEKKPSNAPDYHKTKQLSNKWSVSPYTLIGAGALLAITYLYRRAIGETILYGLFKPLRFCKKNTLCFFVLDPYRADHTLREVFLKETSFFKRPLGVSFRREVVGSFFRDTLNIFLGSKYR